MSAQSKEDVSSNLSKLSLKTTELDKPTAAASNAQRGQPNKKPSLVADSWEDEADNDAEDDQFDAGEDTPIASANPHAGTAAPPPTPLSPVASNSSSSTTGRLRAFPPSTLSSSSSSLSPSGPGFSIPPFDNTTNSASPSTTTPRPAASAGAAGEGPSRRPEKTDAVARRMIASALGMRAPRLTDEQKAYDRAVRDKERKRREEEKEAERKREEEAARARQAIWDD